MEGNRFEGHNDGVSAAGQSKPSGLVVFGQNPHFAYIYKKTEKLVTAVYMITNFIKDNEPLKWTIREKALDLLSINASFNTASLSERRELLKEYQAYCVELVSLSSVAQHAGFISEMNFSILSREFNTLVETISRDENKNANEETVILGPGFFEAGESPKAAPARPVMQAPSAQPSVPSPIQASQPDVLYKGQTTYHAPERPVAKDKDSKDTRRASISKLLSKKGGLTIKDFVATIKGVSEKTVQRELLAMVAEGLLKKEGERRWSTYSLA